MLPYGSAYNKKPEWESIDSFRQCRVRLHNAKKSHSFLSCRTYYTLRREEMETYFPHPTKNKPLHLFQNRVYLSLWVRLKSLILGLLFLEETSEAGALLFLGQPYMNLRIRVYYQLQIIARQI